TKRLKQLTRPSGIITDYTYETNGVIKDITQTDGATQIDRLDYIYDAVNNVDSITDNVGLHDYNYNGFNELTQAIHPAGSGLTTENYSYNKVGNRETPADATAYDYDSNNRITKSPGVASYVFDDDGSMTSNSNGEVYNYNKLSELINYTNGSTTVSYKYDPFGKRLNKTVNGVTTWFLWDRSKLLTEYNNSGQQQKRYTYLPDRYTPTQIADSNGIYDVHTDHRDAPMLLTDSAKNIVWSAQYEAFGKAIINEDVDGNGAMIVFNHRLPGQYFDIESDLYYNRYRYYSPSLGRYITSDPLGIDGLIEELDEDFITQDTNLYPYVINNPLKYVDPFGLAEGGPNATDSAGGSEHTAGARSSTQGKHEKGDARRNKDRGGEKGDANRRDNRKKPKGWKGKWPGLRGLLCPACGLYFPDPNDQCI
ncbi:MAG: RHS repeat-associated core domain-containing protein, partial [Pseudomonadota bacterium]